MKRQKIVAGNWKMNKTYDEGIELAKSIAIQLPADAKAKVVLATPAIHLKGVADVLQNFSNMNLAGQNCHQADKGAFTGELCVDMLQSVGASYVIIGHSERREYFNESNELLAKKVEAALAAGLTPIFCCGEPLPVREAKKHVKYVRKQLKESLFNLEAADFSKIVIAYEPIWAIGTGVTASPEQAQQMHKAIRKMIAKQYGDKVAEKTSILYGGSVKPANAKTLFGQADVDGGLVGGASLKATDFLEIIASF